MLECPRKGLRGTCRDSIDCQKTSLRRQPAGMANKDSNRTNKLSENGESEGGREGESVIHTTLPVYLQKKRKSMGPV